jgi:hypothetical protein
MQEQALAVVEPAQFQSGRKQAAVQTEETRLKGQLLCGREMVLFASDLSIVFGCHFE